MMKISGLQLYWLMVSLIPGLSILLTLAPSIAEAGQDAWISVTIAGLAGLGVMFIAVKISLLYPGQSFVQYSRTILGSWLGKIIVLPYFVMWYSVDGIILRNASDFVYIALFNATPLSVLSILLLILSVYVIYTGGIEGIARCAEIIGPLIVLMILGTCILSINHLDWKQITPVYADSGLASILKGAVPPLAFYCDTFLFIMVFCFLSNYRHALSRTMWGMAVSATLTVLATVMVIMTFGPNLSAGMWFPFFNMTRFISALEFIQNIDILVVIIWMFSVFIKLSLYLFVTAYGTAQWLNLKNWRPLIWFVAPAVFLISLWYKNIAEVVYDFQIQFWRPYVLPVNVIGIPLLLWIAGAIRKKRSGKKVGP